MLGLREEDIYGLESLNDIEIKLKKKSKTKSM